MHQALATDFYPWILSDSSYHGVKTAQAPPAPPTVMIRARRYTRRARRPSPYLQTSIGGLQVSTCPRDAQICPHTRWLGKTPVFRCYNWHPGRQSESVSEISSPAVQKPQSLSATKTRLQRKLH